MSASLVGSEMCIRDSNVCNPEYVCLRHWALAKGNHAVRSSTRDCVRCGVCLLYTSDAADDM
eukprot:1395205-Alexandrium_andersonii.AAC.1